MNYPHLFTPGKIGSLTVKNRGVMSPMSTDYASKDGHATERFIAYYTERAKGGVGLIINEFTGVDDVDSIPTIHNYRMAQDHNLPSAELLCQAIHAYDCKLFAQIHHGGATSKPALTGRDNLSPSGIPMAPGAIVPLEMTVEDIHRIQQKFIAAAVRCQKAGYDGVELHGAHSYLIAQFFSKYYNRRTDNYGGSVENRCRFTTEILSGIREKLGNFPVTLRMCGDEMTPHEGFLTLEDGIAIAQHLEACGMDGIHISNGSAWNANANCEPYSYTPGWKKHVAKAYKEALSIPVIATNTVKTPDFAESLLDEGICDFVSMGRSQFADPNFMNKAKAGKADTITQCIGCMYCRERVIASGMPAACSVNPRLGLEFRYDWNTLPCNGDGRPVAVIGAGPAGLEAGIILAKRGFAVTIFEEKPAIGGTLQVAQLPPHKANLQGLYTRMATEFEALGGTILLNTKATVEAVTALSPVGVFVAAGSTPIVPKSIPGIETAILAEDVICDLSRCGDSAVLVGTGLTGLECAEMVLAAGKHMTLVDMTPELGQGIFPVIRNATLEGITPYNCPEYLRHRLDTVTETGVALTNLTTGNAVELTADTVILALGSRPQEAFTASFTGLQTVAIGSAAKSGRIVDAIQDGFFKAWAFEPL